MTPASCSRRRSDQSVKDINIGIKTNNNTEILYPIPFFDMRINEINKKLGTMVQKAMADLHAEGSEMSEEELLGIVLSVYLRWDGVKILWVTAAALEDANYHRECAVVHGLIEVARKTNSKKD